MTDSLPPRRLSAGEIEQFIEQGFVRIEGAFSSRTAQEARDILWRDLPGTPHDPASWTQPVVRLGQYGQSPFVEAATAAALHNAFDQLVGPGRWLEPRTLGTFPVRFPVSDHPGDTGWHIDMSFGTSDPDFMTWRANVMSRDRSLLMLFLFSDTGTNDAPTRLRVGSHIDVTRQLATAGEAGLTLRELAADGFAGSATRPVLEATGEAGTVYLCHPFLVHAAQAHRGQEPRFLAQPPLLPREPYVLHRPDGAYSTVETAIRQALQ
jgi:hypothetical protein